jgi:hypothetical protein
MKFAALTSAAVICALALAPAALAQSSKAVSKGTPKKDAVPAAPAPPSPELVKARMKPPIKGTAEIEIIKASPKKVGNEIQNITRVKNISPAPIVGLRIDEFFYAGQKEVASGSFRLRHALAPGEVAEMPTAALYVNGITASQMQFSHAGVPQGKVKPTAVKKFTEDKNKT